MKYPDWVLIHKIPNTEIREKNGKYKIYHITSTWCPIKKRKKKVTLKQYGVITEAEGLILTGMSRKGRVPKGASKIKAECMDGTNFLDSFKSMGDPRSTRNRLYTLSEIILVTFLGVTCGADGWQDIENYGKAKLDYLRQYFPYKNGVPSDDTIRRFFSAIDPEQFRKLFVEWVKKLVKTVDAQVIAIDGKCSRRSHDGDGNMLHTVSAFATDARIVLGQEKVENKSNEITAIPKLLDLLDVQGHIITIDAMGCQYSIADKIVSKKADYILALKGNQGTLHEDVKKCFNGLISPKKIGTHTDQDYGHGRFETRECSVIKDVDLIKHDHPHWGTIKSIVRIKSKRKVGQKKETEEVRYYVSSLDRTAASIEKSIRSHWGIENSLHWILDMAFNEDQCRIRKHNAPQAMAIIRHFVLNLLQTHKMQGYSVKGYRKMCAWNDSILNQLITKCDYSDTKTPTDALSEPGNKDFS